MMTRYDSLIKLKNPQIDVAPLLFISLLENGIKHSGISYDQDAWLYLDIKEREGHLQVNMENSLRRTSRESSLNERNPSDALGPVSLRQRLQLIYPNNFEFDFKIKENTAFTSLALDLNA